jgi:acyl-CoA thioesterase II
MIRRLRAPDVSFGGRVAIMTARLAELLNIKQTGADLFEGVSPRTQFGRIFGGLVLAQALAAAERTVDGRAAHSLHAYFILPGDPALPLSYAVERVRDGRSFATRRSVARQNGRIIFELSASFHAPESGLSHQSAMPEVAQPETLLDTAGLAEKYAAVIPDYIRRFLAQERPVELRPVELPGLARASGAAPAATRNIWVRARDRLPDAPAAHRAALAYMSDMTLLDAALARHGRTVFEPSLQVASLDHALWFHRDFRADDWLLYSQDSPAMSGARALTRGLFFAQSGELVASVAQEGLIRERR